MFFLVETGELVSKTNKLSIHLHGEPKQYFMEIWGDFSLSVNLKPLELREFILALREVGELTEFHRTGCDEKQFKLSDELTVSFGIDTTISDEPAHINIMFQSKNFATVTTTLPVLSKLADYLVDKGFMISLRESA